MNAWSYGTTSFGGSYGRGTIYEISLGRHFATTHVFNVGKRVTILMATCSPRLSTEWTSWTAPPTLEELVVVAPPTGSRKPKKGGWALSVLHSFSGLDGDGPGAGLIVDSAGNLYGTTMFGGAKRRLCRHVFELNARREE